MNKKIFLSWTFVLFLLITIAHSIQVTCSESDKGLDSLNAGTATLLYNSKKINFDDKCVFSGNTKNPNGILRETYCFENQVKFQYIECDGACKNNSCKQKQNKEVKCILDFEKERINAIINGKKTSYKNKCLSKGNPVKKQNALQLVYECNTNNTITAKIKQCSTCINNICENEIISCKTNADCPEHYSCQKNECVYEPYCGDRECSQNENRNNCPTDCNYHYSCNNGTCEKVLGSGIDNCSIEGSFCSCGDNICSFDENSINCPNDCAYHYECSSGNCNKILGERFNTCIQDSNLCSLQIENKKNESQYISEPIFVISTNEWLDEEIFPVINWFGDENCSFDYNLNRCYYKKIDYNLSNNQNFEENEKLRSFLEKNSPLVIFVISDSLLESKKIASKIFELYPTINKNKIITRSREEIPLFWKQFKNVIYTDNNIENVKKAKEFASIINAPLVVEGTSLDKDFVFSSREVICFGRVSEKFLSKCNKIFNENIAYTIEDSKLILHEFRAEDEEVKYNIKVKYSVNGISREVNLLNSQKIPLSNGKNLFISNWFLNKLDYDCIKPATAKLTINDFSTQETITSRIPFKINEKTSISFDNQIEVSELTSNGILLKTNSEEIELQKGESVFLHGKIIYLDDLFDEEATCSSGLIVCENNSESKCKFFSEKNYNNDDLNFIYLDENIFLEGKNIYSGQKINAKLEEIFLPENEDKLVSLWNLSLNDVNLGVHECKVGEKLSNCFNDVIDYNKYIYDIGCFIEENTCFVALSNAPKLSQRASFRDWGRIVRIRIDRKANNLKVKMSKEDKAKLKFVMNIEKNINEIQEQIKPIELGKIVACSESNNKELVVLLTVKLMRTNRLKGIDLDGNPTYEKLNYLETKTNTFASKCSGNKIEKYSCNQSKTGLGEKYYEECISPKGVCGKIQAMNIEVGPFIGLNQAINRLINSFGIIRVENLNLIDETKTISISPKISACVECTNDSHCANNETKKRCQTSSNSQNQYTCVECFTTRDCPTNTICINTNTIGKYICNQFNNSCETVTIDDCRFKEGSQCCTIQNNNAICKNRSEASCFGSGIT